MLSFRGRRWVRQYSATLLVLLVGTTATALLGWQLSRTMLAKDRLRFNTAASRVQSEVAARLDDCIDLVRAGAGLTNILPTLDAQQFGVFINGRLDEPRFRAIERIELSRALTRLDPVTRSLLERGDGRVLATAAVDQRVVLLAPIYANGPSATLPEHGDRLAGVVNATLRVEELFAYIFGRGQRPLVVFEVFDGEPSSPSLVFRTADYTTDTRFSAIRQLDVAGRKWSMVIHETPNLDEASSRGLVPGVVAAGFGLTLLLAALMGMQVRARQHVEESEGRVQELLDRERELRAEAERVSKIKDEFLATLGHELRTPLNAIVGWSHILSDTVLSEEERKKALATVQRNAQIQARLIGDLLDMSHIVAGKVRVDMNPIDPSDVVRAAIDVVRPTAQAKGLRLETEIERKAVFVLADASRLQQVVWNVLTNAVKFTPAPGVVRVELRVVDTKVEFSVRDTGIGIAPDFLPFVFERFRQADGSSTRRHGGLGLGLSVVRSLIEMHGGSVRAESPGLGHGATFVFSLPVHEPSERESLAVGEGSDDRANTLTSLTGLRVLVVDDEPDARELVTRLLQNHGMRVVASASAADAARELDIQGKSFDLLICDLGMPQMDGFEFMKWVRALPASEGGATPAIALSAYAREDDQRRALAAGYHYHLTKPFQVEHLIALTASLVRNESAGKPRGAQSR